MFCIHKFRWPNIKWQSYDQAVTGQDEEIQVPVLIVGGSLVGLSTALLLARHGVESLVVERHSGTATARASQARERRTSSCAVEVHGCPRSTCSAGTSSC